MHFCPLQIWSLNTMSVFGFFFLKIKRIFKKVKIDWLFIKLIRNLHKACFKMFWKRLSKFVKKSHMLLTENGISRTISNLYFEFPNVSLKVWVQIFAPVKVIQNLVIWLHTRNLILVQKQRNGVTWYPFWVHIKDKIQTCYTYFEITWL